MDIYSAISALSVTLIAAWNINSHCFTPTLVLQGFGNSINMSCANQIISFSLASKFRFYELLLVGHLSPLFILTRVWYMLHTLFFIKGLWTLPY